ncbi:MAG: hypothetical protein WBO46_12785 [Caldilineaceae bacterium]
MATQVELRLTGNNIQPGHLRGHDLAALLVALEDTIAVCVVSQEPDLRKEAVRVGLADVQQGSFALQFEMNLIEYTLAAFQLVADAVARNVFDGLPRLALAPLRDLKKVLDRGDYSAEFRLMDHAVPLAILTTETDIPILASLKGETVIYGEVMRVGGVEPRIMLRTVQGKNIYCTTSTSIAQAVASRLYSTVALRGQATWNGESLEIEDFWVTELMEYEPIRATDAFAELAALVDDSFYDFDNPDHFLRNLRE